MIKKQLMMNKLILLLPLLILGACAPKYAEHASISDYTKYVQSGFFIFPVGTKVENASYTPLADIELFFYTGKKTKKINIPELPPVKLSSGDIVYIPTKQYATDRIVEAAKKNGANALLNYQLIAKYSSDGKVISYQAKGVAAKIDK